MTRQRTFRVWLGAGAAALIGTAAAGVPSVPAMQGADAAGEAAHTASMPQPGLGRDTLFRIAASGEGGEAGEAGGAADGLDPRVAYLRDSGAIAGHLAVADELVAADRWSEAAVLYRHAAEAVYPRISDALKRHGLRRLDSPLAALAEAADKKDREALATARTMLVRRMAAADAKMRGFAKPWGRLAMQGVMEMLRAAASEYAEAIEGGTIGKAEEYQVGRGLVLAAGKLLDDAASDLERVDKSGVAAVRAGLDELAKAWPMAMPPAAPVKDHAAVLGDISRIELAASKLLRT